MSAKIPYIKILAFIFTSILYTTCKDKQQKNEHVASTNQNIDKTKDSLYENRSVTKKRIVFFGNSLTAGYGLDEVFSFPSLIRSRIDSLKLPYEVVNAGLSGETTSGGKNRIDWILKQNIDVFVLELGANDVLRGQNLEETELNLRAILSKVKTKYPAVKVVLAGMKSPPNMGNTYTKKFASIYPKLANEFNAKLIPFLLENVASIPKLNLQDGKHPNAEGQKIVRENVWSILKEIL